MEFIPKDRYGMADLVEIVRLLREPGGCPWDREQTHESIRKNLIEETYEVAEAIDLGDDHLLCEELGDLLLQIVLHARMEEEAGRFSYEDVCDGICKKLIYRHPHVFKEQRDISTGQVLKNWDALKNREKGRETAAQRLDSVPASLPALMRSEKLQKRAGEYGFAYPGPEAAMEDLDSELAELKDALAAGNREAAKRELGDVLFSAVNVARYLEVDAEEALTGSLNRFAGRVKACEEAAEADGRQLKGLAPEVLDGYWKKAKAKEKAREH